MAACAHAWSTHGHHVGMGDLPVRDKRAVHFLKVKHLHLVAGRLTEGIHTRMPQLHCMGGPCHEAPVIVECATLKIDPSTHDPIWTCTSSDLPEGISFGRTGAFFRARGAQAGRHARTHGADVGVKKTCCARDSAILRTTLLPWTRAGWNLPWLARPCVLLVACGRLCACRTIAAAGRAGSRGLRLLCSCSFCCACSVPRDARDGDNTRATCLLAKCNICWGPETRLLARHKFAALFLFT